MATAKNYQPQGLNTYGVGNGIPGIVGGDTPLFDQARTPTDAGPLRYGNPEGDVPGNDMTGLTPDQNAFLDAETPDERDTRMTAVNGILARAVPSAMSMATGLPVSGALGWGSALSDVAAGRQPKGMAGYLADSVGSLFGVGYAAAAPGRDQPGIGGVNGMTANETSARAGYGKSAGFSTSMDALTGASGSQMSGPSSDGGGGPSGAGIGAGEAGDTSGGYGDMGGYAMGGLVTPSGPPPMQMGAARPPTGSPGLAAPGAAPAPANPQLIDAKINNLMRTQPQGIQKLQMLMQQEVQSGGVTPEQISQLGQIARVCLQNPAMYPQLVRMAEQKGIVPPGTLPPQFNEGVVIRLLLAAKALEESPLGQPGQPGQPGGAPIDMGGEQQMARGGLLRGPGTGTSDSIPAVNTSNGSKVSVSNGEYIIPAKVVKIKGKEFFDNLLRKYADVSGEGSA